MMRGHVLDLHHTLTLQHATYKILILKFSHVVVLLSLKKAFKGLVWVLGHYM